MTGSGLGGLAQGPRLTGSVYLGTPVSGSVVANYYRMRGFSGSIAVQWTVIGMPDTTGTQAPSGSLSNIYVAGSWSV